MDSLASFFMLMSTVALPGAISVLRPMLPWNWPAGSVLTQGPPRTSVVLAQLKRG